MLLKQERKETQNYDEYKSFRNGKGVSCLFRFECWRPNIQAGRRALLDRF